jgi:light-regulated signal transduction histidine kinase (bacteriophytochrome)
VSHDLRAPLRHIDGFASMLTAHLGAQIDDKTKRYVTVINESARRMGRLIDDLLSFSRHGRVELKRTNVRLTDLIDEVRQQLQSETAERNIRWNIEPLPEVYGDVAMLRQVFANLLGNAVKYTRTRSEAVITVGSLPAPGREVIVFVRDNGAGFNPKYAGRLFGVFQRLHSESEFEGTGVGLANVQRILHRHGGRVWAEGKVDEGATFYFALPLRPSESAQT